MLFIHRYSLCAALATWRYAEFFGPGTGAMLIDPAADPHELHNLVNEPQYAEVVAQLSALIAGYAGGKTEPTPT